MKKTLNKCSIRGDIDALNDLKDILQKGFSMNDIVPCENDIEFEKIKAWGTTGDIDFIAAIYNKEYCRLDMTTRTEMPNSNFWRNVSAIFGVTITHSYYVEEYDCVGFNEFMDGDLLESGYSENKNEDEFKYICKKFHFSYSNPKIISMDNILKQRTEE